MFPVLHQTHASVLVLSVCVLCKVRATDLLLKFFKWSAHTSNTNKLLIYLFGVSMLVLCTSPSPSPFHLPSSSPFSFSCASHLSLAITYLLKLPSFYYTNCAVTFFPKCINYECNHLKCLRFRFRIPPAICCK